VKRSRNDSFRAASSTLTPLRQRQHGSRGGGRAGRVAPPTRDNGRREGAGGGGELRTIPSRRWREHSADGAS
jgi:hypothetical protein